MSEHGFDPDPEVKDASGLPALPMACKSPEWNGS